MNAAISQYQSSQSALSVFGNMPCAQCGASLIAPEWSQRLNERHPPRLVLRSMRLPVRDVGIFSCR